ncbi:MAG: Bro-N domain-containing protein [Pseudomonas sp.]|uniref:BRO-N domain-containing protein n=1 Tax=Pseudomonas abieticivorans TaxID=2931382 RepID=UPI0020C16C36|nr:Bro-N domain-containing protein [Pseudomonas sp. PIA16]MDE1165059.1 Bro-N domain-containing protein [Pseudomonas sp.]
MHGHSPADNEPHDSIPFLRHGRLLKALMLEDQAWFCLKDIGRLMGTGLEERNATKLDADQRRMLWLRYDGQLRHTAMVSESGVLALLVYHYVPENRALRQWLTYVVMPSLRTRPGQAPVQGQMCWRRASLSVLYWQSEPWIRLRDMPQVLPMAMPEEQGSWWRKVLGT